MSIFHLLPSISFMLRVYCSFCKIFLICIFREIYHFIFFFQLFFYIMFISPYNRWLFLLNHPVFLELFVYLLSSWIVLCLQYVLLYQHGFCLYRRIFVAFLFSFNKFISFSNNLFLISTSCSILLRKLEWPLFYQIFGLGICFSISHSLFSLYIDINNCFTICTFHLF